MSAIANQDLWIWNWRNWSRGRCPFRFWNQRFFASSIWCYREELFYYSMLCAITNKIDCVGFTISGFEFHWTLSGTSQTALEQIYDTSKRYPRIVGACVQLIPISMNKFAWRFMRACHEELTLCWRVGVIGLISKDFVGNLNKIEDLYIVSHLALQHTFLLSM